MVKREDARKEPERMQAEEARRAFSDCLEEVAYKGRRIVVTRFGKDMAALVSMDDLKKLRVVP